MVFVSGSSPCVWGQGAGGSSNKGRHGIIPMRVGTRLLDNERLRVAKDHPHACGDKLCQCRKRHMVIGSSPCVWGQGFTVTVRLTQFRIIPMRVGTRVTDVLDATQDGHHPHACGDKSLYLHFSRLNLGSSPCVWGQVEKNLKNFF